MAHTPGPWTISPPWSGFSLIKGPNGELIFGLAAGASEEKRSDEECEANAALLAAAPDLLAALKTARGGLAALLEDRATSMDYDVSRNPRILLIDAAIAKAEAS